MHNPKLAQPLMDVGDYFRDQSVVPPKLRILAILIVVMVLNLLAMLYARRIMGGVTVLVLQIFGAVLGVLQVALAVQMILRGLLDLGVL